MAIFEVQGPDGTVYEVDAPDMQQAAAAVRSFVKPQGPAETNMVEQSMSGVNEGIAAMAGMPVDLVTGALNLGSKGINAVAGTDIPPIEDPVGGSGSFRDMLAPTISDTPPQTTAQRYGRRIGQDVGAMAIPGGAMLRGAKAPMQLAGMEAASAVGSGVAGQTAREVAPDSDLADFVASALGGGSPMALSRAARPTPQAPSLDGLREQQAQAYDAVDQSQARLSPQDRQGLIDAIKKRTSGMEMDEFMHPKANRTVNRLESLEASPRIADVEKKRRLISRDVAGSIDPAESAIGQGMKSEMDEFTTGLADSGNLGADGQEALANLQNGRELTGRIKKTEDLRQRIYKAENRAATSGTGGNEVNTTRQNIRALLDNPKQRRAYSPDEISAIEGIVRGTGPINAARLMGRMSPTSGALPLMGNIGAISAGTAAGGPFGTALSMVPMFLGSAGKSIAEGMTKRQVDELDALLRNGKPLPKKTGTQAEKRALIAALMAASASSEQQ